MLTISLPWTRNVEKTVKQGLMVDEGIHEANGNPRTLYQHLLSLPPCVIQWCAEASFMYFPIRSE